MHNNLSLRALANELFSLWDSKRQISLDSLHGVHSVSQEICNLNLYCSIYHLKPNFFDLNDFGFIVRERDYAIKDIYRYLFKQGWCTGQHTFCRYLVISSFSEPARLGTTRICVHCEHFISYFTSLA